MSLCVSDQDEQCVRPCGLLHASSISSEEQRSLYEGLARQVDMRSAPLELTHTRSAQAARTPQGCERDRNTAHLLPQGVTFVWKKAMGREGRRGGCGGLRIQWIHEQIQCDYMVGAEEYHRCPSKYAQPSEPLLYHQRGR
ncbi:hypothetical protein PoB_002017000 [Plakobranchus ocellatus]|uniref:Protein Wnt n=1 Tax=Plakobranchus ocellatus TaxID=259542 RepID=A0AAV3ZDH3_9GAST|nr:hypothetical protein PoB_002017000 [Plakobranchus ocellatus]